MTGLLIAFEGLDQSGKQTQAEMLREHVVSIGRECRLLSFPDYETPIGSEIYKGLHGEREYSPEVMQLLYVSNRYQYRGRIAQWKNAGAILLCDRYLASSIAYGEAQGLDPAWLADIQRFLPRPDLTILLDIAPETAVRRKSSNRDRYERDLPMLARVRKSYRGQAQRDGWLQLDGERAPADVARDVITAVATQLARP